MASGPGALTHAWPRWSPLLVWVLACAVLTAALVVLQQWILRGHPNPRWIELYHFGPALAVGVLWLVFHDHHHRPDVDFGHRPSPRAIGLAVVAVVAGGVVVVTAMAARDTIVGTRTPLPPLELPLAIALASAVVTALGEETAWRAFLQPELEQWWGPLPAAAGVGVAWTLWSVLVRHPGPLGAVAFAVMAISLSVAIGALTRMAGGHRLLLGTLCHATVNVGLLLVLPGHGEEHLTAWALAVAGATVGAALWLVSCFRPATTEEDDPDDDDPANEGDQVEDDTSWGLPW